MTKTLEESFGATAVGRRVYLFAGLGVSLLCLGLASLVAGSVTRPLYRVIRSVSRVGEGEFATPLALGRKDEIGMLADSIDDMTARIVSLVGKVREKERNLRIAEIRALQAQIRPHFIFNCLDLIKWNARMGRQDEVAATVLSLGRLLRAGMRDSGSVVKLFEEWEFISDYLSIQKLRFEERLRIDLSLDPEAAECIIPRFLLQPFVENSLVHGLERKLGGGTIRVDARMSGERVRIEIADDGAGMDPGTLRACTTWPAQEGDCRGVGIRNVLSRLHLHYGGNFVFDMRSSPGTGTTVSMDIPGQPEEAP